MKASYFGAVVVGSLAWSGVAEAADIYVIRDPTWSTHVVGAPIAYLKAQGHTVTDGTATLTDYAAYDQVWDLRFTVGFSQADLAAYDAFLESGGRMYVTSDNNVFSDGLDAIPEFVSAVGGGTVTLSSENTRGTTTQNFTTKGLSLNSPNTLPGVAYSSAGIFTSGTQGFLVTQDAATPGTGSLWAWDEGDLTGAAYARLLVGLDIDVFRDPNGAAWVENLADFLGEKGSPVPEPGAAAMLLAGAGVLSGRRRGRV